MKEDGVDIEQEDEGMRDSKNYLEKNWIPKILNLWKELKNNSEKQRKESENKKKDRKNIIKPPKE